MDLRVAVVCPYFGPLPSYFPLTLRSMEANRDFDWIVLTDQAVQSRAQNVIVHNMSFSDARRAVEEGLEPGIEVTLPRPYKLCDYRPAFGEIFSEMLQPYDWWGHCDLDLIFGRISDVIPREAFKQNDKVLIRGCFALYRNTPAINSMYRKLGYGVDYRAVFRSPLAEHFDEWPGIYRILRGEGVRVWNPEGVIFDINVSRYRLRANYSRATRPTYFWEWETGVTEVDGRTGERRKGALIHLQKRRMRPLDVDLLMADRVYIHGDRFTVEQTHDFRLKSAARFHLARVRRRLSAG